MTIIIAGKNTLTLTSLAAAVLALGACGGNSDPFESKNTKPAYLGAVAIASYDGASDDLLTAGLGKTGLGGTAPAVADPLKPTPAELRRLAIFNNYRAILDISTNGGYGTLYGPNVDAKGVITTGEGKIAGTEYIAYSDDGTGRQNITMMVQVPASFNPANACIVTGTSSGSRGVYGAIGSAGEWGLKNGCAVAYTDKGTGTGIHDLQNNTVNVQNGVRTDAAAAGKNSIFTAELSASERAAFNAATPNRFAVKHAHSQQNPEKDWGKWTLQSVEFAYFVLNEKYGDLARDGATHLKKLTPSNTIVIASSVSNGAGAALAAAEQDTQGLISGVAVAEPEVQLAPDARLSVKRGASVLVGTGKPLYDYFTLANLLQPCAALVSPATNAFNTVNAATATNRCSALKANGLVTGTTTAEQAASALAALVAAGWQPESNVLQASHYSFATLSVGLTYANTYGRFSVKDNLCGFSFAATGAAASATPNAPVPASASALATSFGASNGVPPTIGINIVNNLSAGGPLLDAASLSAGGVQDYNIAGALCMRELATGSSANAVRVRQGMSEVVRSANLRGKPALIVQGRADTLLPVAFTGRPYYGMNKIVEGTASRLSYIEVTNAQHFDAFLAFPGYPERMVPLHRYFIQAMDMMYANLKTGAALPASQVVRTVPRGLTGAVANPIAASNVPPIKTTPAAADQITFANNVVTIAD
ncbi:D-(-)-3-hydroxybutyrate oligomer hydrolase [Polaromonas naphthalenivorans]|uniref:D-(-)-3-hydroxybutyrate oligomer hydrolase n=1 Tax=Polaromonas naphthalenivorans (strain CJ2) TaxID=365044 RepID=HBOH_POLNA|nr:D-(-)-3-hydroxybutyrate oligomer hydrolase [Polaromonas naphthalenivorans]A1VUF3.2 RecName: Full=D-(-)-3-hydroxybutyrate oligomer hydrolase; Short=3HB-oligomer hydrolase; Short=3HBOH; Flags: Precursor [Polaromonas naphthalenivorans CJ2]